MNTSAGSRFGEILQLCTTVNARFTASSSPSYLVTSDDAPAEEPSVISPDALSSWKKATLSLISQCCVQSSQGHILGQLTEKELANLLDRSESNDGTPIYLTGSGIKDDDLRAIVVRIVMWSTVSEKCYGEIVNCLKLSKLEMLCNGVLGEDTRWRKWLCWFVNCTSLTARLLSQPLSSLPVHQITCLYRFLYPILRDTCCILRSLGIVPREDTFRCRGGPLTIERVQTSLRTKDVDLVSYLCTLYLASRSYYLASNSPSPENLQDILDCCRFTRKRLTLSSSSQSRLMFPLLSQFTSRLDKMENNQSVPHIREALVQCLEKDIDPTTLVIEIKGVGNSAKEKENKRKFDRNGKQAGQKSKQPKPSSLTTIDSNRKSVHFATNIKGSEKGQQTPPTLPPKKRRVDIEAIGDSTEASVSPSEQKGITLEHTVSQSNWEGTMPAPDDALEHNVSLSKQKGTTCSVPTSPALEHTVSPSKPHKQTTQTPDNALEHDVSPSQGTSTNTSQSCITNEKSSRLFDSCDTSKYNPRRSTRGKHHLIDDKGGEILMSDLYQQLKKTLPASFPRARDDHEEAYHSFINKNGFRHTSHVANMTNGMALKRITDYLIHRHVRTKDTSIKCTIDWIINGLNESSNDGILQMEKLFESLSKTLFSDLVYMWEVVRAPPGDEQLIKILRKVHRGTLCQEQREVDV